MPANVRTSQTPTTWTHTTVELVRGLMYSRKKNRTTTLLVNRLWFFRSLFIWLNLVQESSVDLWDNLNKVRGLPHNALHFPSNYTLFVLSTFLFFCDFAWACMIDYLAFDQVEGDRYTGGRGWFSLKFSLPFRRLRLCWLGSAWVVFGRAESNTAERVFLSQFQLAFRASKLACGSQVATGHFLVQRASLLGSPRACSPGKFWNLMLQKRPFYAFLMLSASRFSSPGIPKIDLILIICLKRSRKTNILMTLDKCDEPLQHWSNFKPLKKPEAVGELCVRMPRCESELNHCPSKFYFWIQKLLCFY